jgi:hypothetical protein
LTIEELIDLQEAGSRARVIGLGSHENPYLKSDVRPLDSPRAHEDWQVRVEAWNFGWEAEDASREGRMVSFISSLIRHHERGATA